jgi:hypothetical protein
MIVPRRSRMLSPALPDPTPAPPRPV